MEEDFDWCLWGEMKKSTLTYIRLKAKEKGEPREITRTKLDAVRAQQPEDGHIAIFTYKKDGHKVWDGVVIKKR